MCDGSLERKNERYEIHKSDIFRAALPVIATNLANQQGNHDIAQLPNSNFHGCFFFLFFFF